MKGMKKLLALACAVVVACPITAFAAPLNAIAPAADTEVTVAVEKANSGAKYDLSKADVTVKKVGYAPRMQKAEVTVVLNGKTLKEGTHYVVADGTHRTVGSHKVTVYGIGKYTGSKTATMKITKGEQAITIKAPSVSAAAVAKKSKTYQLKVSGVRGNAKVTYSSDNSKLSINKDGKITVKKGTKKGTKATITVKVAESENYKAAKKSVTIKVTK